MCHPTANWMMQLRSATATSESDTISDVLLLMMKRVVMAIESISATTHSVKGSSLRWVRW